MILLGNQKRYARVLISTSIPTIAPQPDQYLEFVPGLKCLFLPKLLSVPSR